MQRRRDARRRAARRILGPGHGHVEIVRQGPRAPVGNQRTRDGHLAIADLAERATVLPLHADRARPLLRKPRVVDRENAGAHGHHRAQVCPDTRRVPRGVRDEMLQRLILAGITEPAMHRLHGLPLAVVEQAVEILTRRPPLRLSAEAGAEPIEVLTQAPQQRPRGPRRHARSVRPFRCQRKVAG